MQRSSERIALSLTGAWQGKAFAKGLWTGLLLIGLQAGVLTTSQAQFVERAGFPRTDNAGDFRRLYDWTWPANGTTPALIDPNTNNWKVSLRDTGAAGVPTLNIQVQHRVGFDDPNEVANTAFSNFTIPNLAQPPGMNKLVYDGAAQVTHGPAAGHNDYSHYRLTVNGAATGAPQAVLNVSGRHGNGTRPFEGSFANASGRDLTVVITPSYRVPGGGVQPGDPINLGTLRAGGTITDVLRNLPGTRMFPGLGMGTLSDYNIRTHGSG